MNSENVLNLLIFRHLHRPELRPELASEMHTK
jgi:hypothetical protein